MMRQVSQCLSLIVMAGMALLAAGQESAVAPGVVPQLISYSGVLKDGTGRAVNSPSTVTFLIYKDAQHGAPLWIETQSVLPDEGGHYSVQLGSKSADGLPADLFQSGEARWMALRIAGEPEQARVLLVAVPYAMKAADAQTLGGLPASAFVLAGAPNAPGNNSARPMKPMAVPLATANVTTTGGTVNAIPLFSTATNIQNSILTQTGTTAINVGGNLTATGVVSGSRFQIGSSLFAFGSGTSAFLGFAGNTTTTGPRNTASGYKALAANTTGGHNTADGGIALTADTTGGYNTATGDSALTANLTGSYNTAASSLGLYNNTSGSNNTAIGFDALNFNTTGSNNTGLGYESGATIDGTSITGTGNTFVGSLSAAKTNLSNATAIGANAEVDASNAMVLGSISGVNGATASTKVGIGTTAPAATLDVHGTGNFTGLVTFAAGQAFPGAAVISAPNTFTGNQTVTGNLSASGVVTGSGFQIGSNLFAYAPGTNAFLGFAGNATVAGGYNTASGAAALGSETTGSNNTANGYEALHANTTGSDNAAVGEGSLYWNTTGGSNTAIGFSAGAAFPGPAPTPGNNNTFLGAFSNYGTTANLTNATAIGADAQVLESNAMVLGSISGVNGATASTKVGIGTSTPAATLDVHGTANFTGLVTFAPTQTFGWTVAPTNADTANAIVKRDASGNFSAGAITASSLATTNSTVTGLLQVSGQVAAAVGLNTPAISASSTNTAATTIQGVALATSGATVGVHGETRSGTGGNAGVYGLASAASGAPVGVRGVQPNGSSGVGVVGQHGSPSTESLSVPISGMGVWGDGGAGPGTAGVVGSVDDGFAGYFLNNSASGDYTVDIHAANAASIPLIVSGPSSASCYVDSSGDLFCTGTINGSAKKFRLDHPLDPANKYLVHASVESSEMKNIYDGVVTTDARGDATVQLPDWFEAANGDFRYQLTVIGQFAQAIVAREIKNHEFAIKTSVPNVKVSWQVTGVRNDAWARSHPLVVEEPKDEKSRGYYLHPELRKMHEATAEHPAQ